jgi:pyrroline-5-carboxylate reductase
MGTALVQGVLAAGWCAASEVVVVEKLDARRSELELVLPGVDVRGEAVAAAGAILAVKPVDLEGVCRSMPATDRVLSIAAGVPLASLEAWLPDGSHVVRSMPNLPAAVGAGATAIAPGASATDDDLAWAEGILSAVGAVVRVPERLLDAVTGLSGSGPAYFFLVVEAMVEAGVLEGLPRDVASTLAVHTLVGAGRLLVETGDTPEALRAAVTSPAGTTAAGLSALEQAGVRAAFLDAVAAATERSRQLGRA